MSTFTPGPWELSTAKIEGLIVSEGEKKRIRRTNAGETLYPVCKVVTGFDRYEDDANARLISAAPDLLEACFLAWVEIDQFHSTAYPECEGGCPAHQALDRIKAAVSKALEREATYEDAQSFMWNYRPPEVKS